MTMQKEDCFDQEEMTMEEAFTRLGELLSSMEQGEHTLEETFSLYGEGLRLVKYCGEKIDAIEKQLLILEEQER